MATLRVFLADMACAHRLSGETPAYTCGHCAANTAGLTSSAWASPIAPCVAACTAMLSKYCMTWRWLAYSSDSPCESVVKSSCKSRVLRGVSHALQHTITYKKVHTDRQLCREAGRHITCCLEPCADGVCCQSNDLLARVPAERPRSICCQSIPSMICLTSRCCSTGQGRSQPAVRSWMRSAF